MAKFLLVPVLIFTIAAPSLRAEEPAVVLLHSMDGNNHCYRIVHDGNKPLSVLTLGRTWAAQVFPDGATISVNEKPPAWHLEEVVDNRAGYKSLVLTAPRVAATAKIFPKGYVGRFCTLPPAAFALAPKLK